jgi:hypothetical protein
LEKIASVIAHVNCCEAPLEHLMHVSFAAGAARRDDTAPCDLFVDVSQRSSGALPSERFAIFEPFRGSQTSSEKISWT